jgi:hypothetical protein
MEADMKHANAHLRLGERYLPAEPLLRRIEERKPFFVESRSWLDPRRLTKRCNK